MASASGADGPAPAAVPAPRLAVVTPYHRESRATLERCLRSVREQTLAADHFVVADGFPQEWVAGTGVRHVALDRAHADYGGTARAIGCLLATSEGYDAIALLDADNWFEPDHLEHCLAAARAVPGGICDYVIARLRCVRPDGSEMAIVPQPVEEHVDTSCFVFLRGAYHALPIWALMPREASIAGDRYFYAALRVMKLIPAVAGKVTVNYTSRWELHYRLLGETPPSGVRPTVVVDAAHLARWLNSLPNSDPEVVERLIRVMRGRGREDAGSRAHADDEHGRRGGDTPAVVVVSFYMANIPAEVRNAQRAVLDRFRASGVEFVQIETDRSHADALTAFMADTDADVVVFLDIDCVPLHAGAIPDLVARAARGELAGCVQRANHIDNGAHLYVGPFCMALSKRLWVELGCPSFRPTLRGDVGEEITYLAEARNTPIHMLWPTEVEEPVWDLTPGVRFGLNTVYGGSFLHTFEVRHAANARRFVERCRSICEGREVSTDKEYWHRYTERYERAFATLGEVKDVFEFGVLNGDSVRWLARRFPHARIVAADVVSRAPAWPVSDQIEYVQVDQGDRRAIREMFTRLEREFDLVIDDGSHIPQHQAGCLIEAWPLVRPGKLYIVEDIHTSHPDNADFRHYSPPGAANCLHVLLAIQHLKDCGRTLTPELAMSLASPGFFTPAEVARMFEEISTLELYRRTSLPLRCYRCGASEFDYRRLRCACGADLYSATDSMTFLIQKSRS